MEKTDSEEVQNMWKEYAESVFKFFERLIVISFVMYIAIITEDTLVMITVFVLYLFFFKWIQSAFDSYESNKSSILNKIYVKLYTKSKILYKIFVYLMVILMLAFFGYMFRLMFQLSADRYKFKENNNIVLKLDSMNNKINNLEPILENKTTDIKIQIVTSDTTYEFYKDNRLLQKLSKNKDTTYFNFINSLIKKPVPNK